MSCIHSHVFLDHKEDTMVHCTYMYVISVYDSPYKRIAWLHSHVEMSISGAIQQVLTPSKHKGWSIVKRQHVC